MKTYSELFGSIDYPVLLMNGQNIFYTTGFYTTACCPGQIGYYCALLMEKQTLLFVPENWKEVVSDLISECPVEVLGYQGGIANLAAKLQSFLSGKGMIGYEKEEMSLSLFLLLKEKNPQIVWVDVSDDLKEKRLIKTEKEIEKLRRSASLAREAMEYAKQVLCPGKSEMQIVAELEYFMRKKGSEGVPFTMKALAGENAVRTINLPGNRMLKEGDIVLLDFGATVQNYASDWTRSFCIGKAKEKQKELYRLVWEIERSCIKMIRPGTSYEDIMEKALEIVKGHPFEEYFNPYLGHSIGINSQEWPPIVRGAKQKLCENMVITIEPGVYVPGIGGVRIEDEVLVTKEGYEILTGLAEERFELQNGEE